MPFGKLASPPACVRDEMPALKKSHRLAQPMKDTDARSTWGLAAAISAAVAASACCLLPFALISLGVTGAWMGSLTALAPYQPVFATLALVALGYAGYREYTFSRKPDCDCDPVLSATTRRALLGVGTVVVVGLLASSWIVAGSPLSSTQAVALDTPTTERADAPGANTPASAERVVLHIEGMTCATCAPSVERALGRVEGVYHADVTYDPPEAVVRFDAAKTSVETLTEATAAVGFPSHSSSPE